MTLTSIIIALTWGAVSGLLIPRVLDGLLGLIFCLHGLLLVHWKRLASKAATGLIRSGTLCGVMFWICLSLLLFGSTLKLGYDFTVSQFGFDYRGTEAVIWGVVTGGVALSQFPAMRRRLVSAWKMSHEYDYAERRKRTRMLRI